MSLKCWKVQIAAEVPDELPMGSDLPMRQAVQQVFQEVTGVESEICFSGWGATLSEVQMEILAQDRSRRS